MRKWIWTALVALPLAVAGGLYANAQGELNGPQGAFVCPVTGEELPCPKCCPLNQGE